MKRPFITAVGACLLFLFSQPYVSAQTPQTSIGEEIGQDRQLERDRVIERKLRGERKTTEEVAPAEAEVEDTGKKILVKDIIVEGSTILPPEKLESVVSQYEGKELSLRMMKQAADELTAAYRSLGYVTSRAYIPPQTMKDGVLVIRVVEGKLGEVKIEGNRYFSEKLIRKNLDLTEGGYFDFSALQNSMVYINEHPDRTARVTLMPGAAAGTTDVVVQMEDRLPVHVGFEYDNFGSRYIGRDRFAGVLEHNNLLGFDDKLYVKYQQSDAARLVMKQARYVFPVSQMTDLGVYAIDSDMRLGKELQLTDTRGEADIYGIFSSTTLTSEPEAEMRLNFGFDYKDVQNFILGTTSSHDELRVARAGLDIDWLDAYGRNIFIPEFHYGIPDFLGGMDKKDPDSSRAGAGGKFTKGLLSYYRLQATPYETSFLWKNSLQYTNYNLPAVEQFQIGGPYSVRGYPVGEFSGDSGFYTSPELSIPFYFIPKEWEVPLSNGVRMYDANRFVLFYDWGFTSWNSTDQKKKNTLKGVGFGYRFNVRDNVAFRVEVGYPIGKDPSDGDEPHPWVELVTKF